MTPSGLWQDRNFKRLWVSQTISMIGSQITFLALPLTAVALLDATPLQMGGRTAVGGLPALVIGLLVGVWVDRRQRKPVLVATDVGRGVLAALLSMLALLGGVAGMRLGLRQALLLAAFREFLAVAWLLMTPNRSLQEPRVVRKSAK